MQLVYAPAWPRASFCALAWPLEYQLTKWRTQRGSDLACCEAHARRKGVAYMHAGRGHTIMMLPYHSRADPPP